MTTTIGKTNYLETKHGLWRIIGNRGKPITKWCPMKVALQIADAFYGRITMDVYDCDEKSWIAPVLTDSNY